MLSVKVIIMIVNTFIQKVTITKMIYLIILILETENDTHIQQIRDNQGHFIL